MLFSGCTRRPNPVKGNSFRFKLNQMTAKNEKFEISYAFREDPICYTPQANIYPIGHMVVANKDDKVLKLFESSKFIALIKTSNDEALANVQLDVSPYKVLDWSNMMLDAFEYRVDIPAGKTVRLPLHLDVRYASGEVIQRTIGNESEITVEIYPCNFIVGLNKEGSDRLPFNEKLWTLKMELPQDNENKQESPQN